MRKARFKMMLVGAVTAVALLFAGVNGLHAQTDTQDPFGSLPSGNFVGAAEAVNILTGHVVSVKGVLATLTPGTASYLTTERAVLYYDYLKVEIENGKDIPNSILEALGFVATYQSDSYPSGSGIQSAATPIVQLVSLRDDAINMLSQ